MSHDQAMVEAGDVLADELGYWKEHPDYPFEDWQYEVANNSTRRGYWAWVADCIESATPQETDALQG
jgi:hypothetical protein